MGISIEQYRSRIGKYLPNIQRRVQIPSSSTYVQILPKYLVFLVTTAVLMFASVSCYMIIRFQQDFLLASQSYCSLVYPISTQQVSYYLALSNFSARYLYGNKQPNGIKIAHLNKGPGYLASKICDIENAISSLKPHILGISEANFLSTHDVNDVQLSEYSLH